MMGGGSRITPNRLRSRFQDYQAKYPAITYDDFTKVVLEKKYMLIFGDDLSGPSATTELFPDFQAMSTRIRDLPGGGDYHFIVPYCYLGTGVQ